MTPNLYESGYIHKGINTEVYFEGYGNRSSFRPMKSLSERVASKMKGLGLKQPRLAMLCGVSQPTINRLLKGETQNPPYIYELAKALETSVQWLKTGVNEIAVQQAVGDIARSPYQKAINSMTATEEAAEIFSSILIASPDTQRLVADWLSRHVSAGGDASSGKSTKSKKKD